MTEATEVIVVCKHCPWRSIPVPADREWVEAGGIKVQLAGTPMQNELGLHVIADHRPLQHAWLEGRDWEVVPA